MHAPALPPQSENRSGVDRLKTEFLASLDHEIRTPLTGVIGMMDLLEETTLAGDQREYVVSARLCAEELLRQLNSAVEYSALTSGHLTLENSRFNLPEFLASAAAYYAERADAKGLAFSATISPELPGLVASDAVRLRQILSHLLENALKFTPAGEVEFTVSGSRDAATCRLSIRVRDTGIGIPESGYTAIFEVFRQLDSGLGRKYPGMGLGLALVRELVRQMDGEVRVSSVVGQGSTFEVLLPIEIVAEPVPGARTSGPARILLVEDNDLSQRVAAHMLRRAHFDVDLAWSGADALAAVRRGSFDLILMDLQMPEMDGFETARAIRAVEGYETVPIAALTAHSGDEYRAHCLANGMQDFISKPLRVDELLRVVKRLTAIA